MKIVEAYEGIDIQMIEVKSAEYAGDFVVKILFNDGIIRHVNFKPFLETSLHPSIRKYLIEDNFRKFVIIDGNLNWNNYDMIFPIYDLYKGKI